MWLSGMLGQMLGQEPVNSTSKVWFFHRSECSNMLEVA